MKNSEIGDGRLLTNLSVIENGLEGLTHIKGYEHNFDTDKVKDYKRHYGLIAQEVEKEFPHLVKENFKVNKHDPVLYKTIDHNQLIAVMVQAIGQLNDKINKLQEEINFDKYGK
jgi:hypothetical protein